LFPWAIGSLVSVAACSSASPPEDTTTRAREIEAGDELESHGVHFIEAAGTAERATLTFEDEARNVIGGARIERLDDLRAEIDWRGAHWQVRAGGDLDDPAELTRDGVAVPAEDPEGEEASEVVGLALQAAQLPSGAADAASVSAAARSCQKVGQSCGGLFRSPNCCEKTCVGAGFRAGTCQAPHPIRCVKRSTYCGGSISIGGIGKRSSLYRCNGNGKVPSFVEVCSRGCSVHPGNDDSCR
jgi:hypothetical protein